MKLVLLGEPGSRRTAFWKKAAKAEQQDITCIPWSDYRSGMFDHCMVKIDPPDLHTDDLHKMNETLRGYCSTLHSLQKENCRFFNEPEGILQLLDKAFCKKKLQRAGIPVTPLCFDGVTSLDDLLEQMDKTHIFSVFLKPIYSSGAAGVTAFRFSPRTGRMVVYTSSLLQDGVLWNTKKLRRMEQRDEIRALLNEIFSLGVVIERWIPKQQFQNKSYDLRLVFQFDHLTFGVARQSHGPITNLHLNNQALSLEKLSLSDTRIHELEVLCRLAMQQFAGIQMAGIDVLFEQHSGKPYIIEMNGQGDLLYQDIFLENKIYREQIRLLS